MAFEAIFESALQQVNELEAYCLPWCNFWPNPKTAKVYHAPFFGVYQCNKLHVQNLLVQLFICGKSQYLFPKYWNWQICHTSYQAFKLPVYTISDKLQPRRGLHYSPLNPTVHFGSLLANSAWFSSGKKAAINGAKGSWRMLFYTVHITLLSLIICALKIVTCAHHITFNSIEVRTRLSIVVMQAYNSL